MRGSVVKEKNRVISVLTIGRNSESIEDGGGEKTDSKKQF